MGVFKPDLNVVARLPNVVVPKKDDVDPVFLAGIESALTTALDDLTKLDRELRQLLGMDIELNAQGLEVWLDR